MGGGLRRISCKDTHPPPTYHPRLPPPAAQPAERSRSGSSCTATPGSQARARQAPHLPLGPATSAACEATATYSPRKAENLPPPAASPLFPRATAHPASLLLKAAHTRTPAGQGQQTVSAKQAGQAAPPPARHPACCPAHTHTASSLPPPPHTHTQPAHPGTAPPPRAAWPPAEAARPAACPAPRWAHPQCPAPPAPRCECRPASWPARHAGRCACGWACAGVGGWVGGGNRGTGERGAGWGAGAGAGGAPRGPQPAHGSRHAATRPEPHHAAAHRERLSARHPVLRPQLQQVLHHKADAGGVDLGGVAEALQLAEGGIQPRLALAALLQLRARRGQQLAHSLRPRRGPRSGGGLETRRARAGRASAPRDARLLPPFPPPLHKHILPRFFSPAAALQPPPPARPSPPRCPPAGRCRRPPAGRPG